MSIKSLKMLFLSRIIKHKLCMIFAFFDFFVQKSFLTKNYFFIAVIDLTTRSPCYTCLDENTVRVRWRAKREFFAERRNWAWSRLKSIIWTFTLQSIRTWFIKFLFHSVRSKCKIYLSKLCNFKFWSESVQLHGFAQTMQLHGFTWLYCSINEISLL